MQVFSRVSNDVGVAVVARDCIITPTTPANQLPGSNPMQHRHHNVAHATWSP